jgi:hypothetical protein
MTNRWLDREWFRTVCRVMLVAFLAQIVDPTRPGFSWPHFEWSFGPTPAYGASPPAIAVGRSLSAISTDVQNHQLTISYMVFNLQATEFDGVSLGTTLQPGVSFTSATPLPDQQNGQALTWSLCNLAALESANVRLTVALDDPIPLQRHRPS